MPVSPQERHAREQADLKRLANVFRRRHHYMCRNRDGSYSNTDLNLALFAADVALRLAEYSGQLMLQAREKQRLRIAGTPEKSKEPWKHEALHLTWYENAERQDIMHGEAEDYRNLLSAMHD